jgi:hypothetical protein
LQTGFRARHVLESTCTSAQPVAEIKPEAEGIAPTSTVDWCRVIIYNFTNVYFYKSAVNPAMPGLYEEASQDRDGLHPKNFAGGEK